MDIKKNIKFVHHTEILFNKTNRYTEFQIFIFGNATLHVSGSFPAHHQELSTVESALAPFMQVSRPFACRVNRLLPGAGCSW